LTKTGFENANNRGKSPGEKITGEKSPGKITGGKITGGKSPEKSTGGKSAYFDRQKVESES
jgi:hypothetical protein